MSTAQLSPGTVVDGKLTIVAPVHGRAGAHSYSATDEGGQPVWLTIYDASCFPSALVMERSLRELRQLQNVSSPRVATVLACGKVPDGGVYEVTAPIAGERLDLALAQGPMSPADASALMEQVGAGLLEAQKAGVIHRNLGPRVIYIADGQAVVTGFAVGEPHGGDSRGPLDTIAPEQIDGKVVDQRTLIYNLAAMMHMLLTGSPIFEGDPTTQLEHHRQTASPAGVNSRLTRALGKDPRMRPMMLKQFINDLRAIGGAPARAPSVGGGPKAPGVGGGSSTPRGRGWTMFMKAEGADEPAAPTAPAAPSVPTAPSAPAVAPSAAPAVAPPAAAAPAGASAGKPKTRGWTMFMEAADDDAAEAEPAAAEPAAAKPSTRGWTMFTEADEGDAAAAEEPAAAAPSPSAPAAAEPAAGKPKTRGWTMFMEADESEAEAPSTPAQEPAAPAKEAGAAAPAVEGKAAKPSTRGWTMFMEDDGGDEAGEAQAPAVAAPPVASPPVASPPVASPPVAAAAAAPSVGSSAPAAGAPKSRGWTMFMEPASDGTPDPALAVPSVDSEPAVPEVDFGTPSSAEPAAAAPAQASADLAAEPAEPAAPAAAPEAEGDAPSKKRGWTMFMERPIEEAAKEELGGAVPSTDESTAKGWTVFSPAATKADPVPEGGGVGSKTVVNTGPPAASPSQDAMPPIMAEDGEASGGRSRTVVAEHAPLSRPGRPQTLVAPTKPARPQTMVTPPGSGPAAMAGQGGPESGPIADSVSGPISVPLTGALSQPVTTGPISEPVSGAIAPMPNTAMEPKKKGNAPLIIGAGVAVAAAIAAAAWFAMG